MNLRLVRSRHVGASVGRVVQPAGRREPAAHSLSRRGSGAERSHPGRVDVMFNNIGAVMPLIEGGKLRALGITSIKRAAALPDVPTVAEEGVPGFDVSAWYALFVPARTPEAMIRQAQRRHRRGAGRSRHQGAAGTTRRWRHRLDAGGTARASEVRDG